MDWYPIIGLEIHVQLNTRTKLFCSCVNEYNPDNPNRNICPFCTGQPGALPVLNKEAVKKALLFGAGVQGTIPAQTRWDRKNYFYADLPAGYQISQYDNPIVEGGKIEFYTEEKNTGEFIPSHVTLTRAHLEADAGKLLHAGGKTLIDYNRSGAPLIEIVTDPVIRSAEEAMAFVNELQLLVRRLGISEANMDRGQMRFDCNLSLQTLQQKEQGILPSYRTETKNINSVRALGRAIEYETKRQTQLLEDGTTPVQETRGWKDDLNKSVSQRSKEDAMDYRYFPEPDIPLLVLPSKTVKALQTIPEIPSEQRKRYITLGLSIQTANTLVTQNELGSYFDTIESISDTQTTHKTKKTSQSQDNNSTNATRAQTIANIITIYLKPLSEKYETSLTSIITTQQLLTLAELLDTKRINNQGLQKILDLLASTPETETVEIEEFAQRHNLLQINDDSILSSIVEAVIVQNPVPVADYKGGKEQSIGFLIGQCMKQSKGSGNPQMFRDLLVEALK